MPVGMRVLCSAMIAAIATGVRWRGLAFDADEKQAKPAKDGNGCVEKHGPPSIRRSFGDGTDPDAGRGY
jgi:hypothetical protein